jgi:hypothetical protein
MSFESVTIDHILKRIEEGATNYQDTHERADAIRELVAVLETKRCKNG